MAQPGSALAWGARGRRLSKSRIPNFIIMKNPLILVSNDDGFRSEGIQALTKAMQGLGQVIVVAPDSEQRIH